MAKKVFLFIAGMCVVPLVWGFRTNQCPNGETLSFFATDKVKNSDQNAPWVYNSVETPHELSTFPMSTRELKLPLKNAGLTPYYVVVKDVETKVTMALYQSMTKPGFLVSCWVPFSPEISADDDNMVCRSIKETGRWDMHVAGAIRVLVGQKCQASSSKDLKRIPLVVDVGANVGFETLYAASHGCRVVSFEPDPRCTELLKYSIKLNGYDRLVTLHSNIVYVKDGDKLLLNANPNKPANNQVFVPTEDNPSCPHCQPIATSRIDSVVKEDVLLMKIDVEGFEWHVLQASTSLFDQFNVANLVVEMVPRVLKPLSGLPKAGVEILEFMDKLGYEGRVLRFVEQRDASFVPEMIVESVIEPKNFDDFIDKVTKGKVEWRGFDMADVWFAKKGAAMPEGVKIWQGEGI